MNCTVCFFHRFAGIMAWVGCVVVMGHSTSVEEYEGGISLFKIPFIVSEHPAWCTEQSGFSSGFSNHSPWLNKKNLFIAGINGEVEENGFGFSYRYPNEDAPHILCGGFSHRLHNASLGGSLKSFITSKQPLRLRAGMSGRFKVRNGHWLGATAETSLGSDTSTFLHSPSLQLLLAGSFRRRIVIRYDISGSVSTSLPFEKSLDYFSGIEVGIRKEKNPHIGLFTSAGFTYSEKKETVCGGGVEGTGVVWNRTLGCRLGYYYNVGEAYGVFHTAAYFNPRPLIELSRLSVSLRFSKTHFQPDGEKQDNYIIISLSCRETGRKQGIRYWTCIISPQPDKQKEPVVTWSGGNNPPSSIRWDGRDSSGMLQPPGTYFIRFMAINNNGTVAHTGWRPLTIEE